MNASSNFRLAFAQRFSQELKSSGGVSDDPRRNATSLKWSYRGRKDYFGKPLEEVPMDPETKKFIESLLIFRHRPEVSRLIFISTPHRGSELASNWIGRIGTDLVKLPANLTKTGDVVVRFEIKAGAGVEKPNRMRFPTSIDTLSPNNRFVLILNTLPIANHIPYHSIIGDRGGVSPGASGRNRARKVT